MHCPFCNLDETKVIDSRLVNEGSQVRRRRECVHCNERFTTFEVADLALPKVIKHDKSRVAFDEQKLRAGLSRALEKRPISAEQLETAISNIKKRLRECGEREVSSRHVGEMVMDELRKLDEVAYVRFASVYRRFQDVDAFKKEIASLKESDHQE